MSTDEPARAYDLTALNAKMSNKRLAIILGSGPIVDEVVPRLSLLGTATHILGVHQNGATLQSMIPNVRLIKPLRLQAALDVLADLQIDAVAFAGSAGHVSDFLRRRMGLPDRLMLNYVKKVGFFTPPQSYLKSIKLALEERRIELLGIVDLFDDMSVETGFFVGSDEEPMLRRAIKIATDELRKQPMFYVRQSHIIDINTGAVIGRETTGTDGLIRKHADRSVSENEKAVLIKLPLEPYTKVDAPVIGLTTVTECMRAGIGGIVVKAKETVVLQRAQIKALCENTKFFIYAFD